MSIPTLTTNAAELDGWIEPAKLQAAGYHPAGPEIDYGQRWGTTRSIRVTYAPFADTDRGFLYAHDRATGQSLLLASDTTAGAVDQAYQLLPVDDSVADGHLALAAVLNERPLEPAHAVALWTHCVTREIDARSLFFNTSEPEERFTAASGVLVNESARLSAEQLLHQSLVAGGHEPVLIRYRVPEWPGWSARLAATDIDQAMLRVRTVLDMTQAAGFSLQATSVSRGASIVAAARVPEFGFVANVPRLEPGIAPAF